MNKNQITKYTFTNKKNTTFSANDIATNSSRQKYWNLRGEKFIKAGAVLSCFICIVISIPSKADDCNNILAIEQYNSAVSKTDINKKLTLLEKSASACSTTYEILIELGDAYFENQRVDQAINTYSRALNRMISDSQLRQAQIFMRLMYAYDNKSDRLAVNQYAHKIQLLKANGMTWDKQSEQAYQSLYQKVKQQLTISPITPEELSKSLDQKNDLSNKNLALVGVNESLSTPSVQIDMDIKFSHNSASLTANSKAILNQIINTLSKNINSINIIEIIGHTDSTGSAEYNLKLSEQRAQAVSNYIKNRSTNLSGKIHSLGVGESQPVDTANTIAAHATNRRVVFKIR